MSGFVLRRYFGKPDIHFFSNPNDALQSIKSTGVFAPPTLIFLDTHSNGMSWHSFLQHFFDLPDAVQGRYRVFVSASKTADQSQFPNVNMTPRPLNLAVLQEMDAKDLFRHYSPNSILSKQGIKVEQLQQSRK